MPRRDDFPVVVDRDQQMRTRDGVVLRADVYRPDRPGRFPVLLLRTPYGKREALAGDIERERDYFPRRGFVVVVQDTRGRHSSDGTFAPFVHEAPDGYDSVEWAASLGCSDGRVFTIGQSLCATHQYLLAPTRPPHLAGCVPVAGPTALFHDCVFHNGVFELSWMLTYFMFMARDTIARDAALRGELERIDGYLRRPDVPLAGVDREHLRHLPLQDWGVRLAPVAPHVAEFLARHHDGPYWWELDARRRAADVAVPMLHVGSWFDGFQFDTLEMYERVSTEAVADDARRGQSLLMGPWAHQMSFFVPTSGGAGEIDFGPDARVDLHAIQLEWIESVLDPGLAVSRSPVRIFVIGDNCWRDEDEWPLRRARSLTLHLRSGGAANTSRGDGRLTLTVPEDEPADTFVYDPGDPVPTRGGTVLGLPAGVFDQSQIEARPDVLVYTSSPLAGAVEVTGRVRATLYVATSATDTDFTAKLVDVDAEGGTRNVVDGVVRGSLHRSLESPTLLTPGETYRFEIDLWSTSWVFAAGHRIRLLISSSNFPRWDRNPNTGDPFGHATRTIPARQVVFHDQDRPSHVTLPVIPDRGDPFKALSARPVSDTAEGGVWRASG